MRVLCCRAALALVLLAGSAAFAATEEIAWKPFTSKEGGFSVSFPGTPQASTQKVDTALGAIEIHLLVVGRGEDEAYVVSYNDYPADATKDPDTVLTGAQKGALTNMKAELKSEKKITLSGHPGREYTGSGENGTQVNGRVYLVENRLYQMIALR